jgi:hypothetical protein
MFLTPFLFHRSEILPLRLRQRGSSVSTASNWICNFLIVQITPPAIQNIGWKTYIIFAILNAVWVPIIYVFYPETKGLELEDVDRIFARGHIGFGRPRRDTDVGEARGAVETLFHEKHPEVFQIHANDLEAEGL